jgi:hypothetical protein
VAEARSSKKGRGLAIKKPKKEISSLLKIWDMHVPLNLVKGSS